MSDRHWVGGTANWDGTAGLKWALTAGGAGGQAVPTAADDVFLDAASGAVVVTISAAGRLCKNLDCTGFTGTLTGSQTLTASGSVTMDAGMGLTWTGTLTLNGSAGPFLITSNGKVFQNGTITVAASGNYKLADAFQMNAATANLTVSAAGAVLDVNGKDVTFGGTGTTTITGPGITGAFGNFSRTGGAALAGTLALTNQDLTVNGTFSATGSASYRRLRIFSNTVGTARTISCAAFSGTDADFTDITITGAAAPVSGTRLGDATGNTGINFAAPSLKYWVGNTGSTGGPAVWATVSGGAAGANNYPLPQDTAVFDANSFSANGQTVTADAPRLGSIDFSAITKTGITYTGGNISYYGDVNFGNAGVAKGASSTSFVGRKVQLFTPSSGTWQSQIAISQGTLLSAGTVKLLANCLTDTAAALNTGYLDLNGFAFECPTSAIQATAGVKSSAAGGIFRTNTTAATTAISISAGATFDRTGNNWKIEVAGNTTNNRSLLPGGSTLPDVVFTNTTPGGNFIINGSGTVRSIQFTGGVSNTLFFASAATINFETSNCVPTGSAGNVVTIRSTAAGNHALNLIGGGVSTVVSRDFLTVQNSDATPAGAWGAGHNSTDVGTNTGWNFGDAFLSQDSDALAAVDTSSAASAPPIEVDVAEAVVAVDDQSAFTPPLGVVAEEVSSAETSWSATPRRVGISYHYPDAPVPPPAPPSPYPVRVHDVFNP